MGEHLAGNLISLFSLHYIFFSRKCTLDINFDLYTYIHSVRLTALQEYRAKMVLFWDGYTYQN